MVSELERPAPDSLVGTVIDGKYEVIRVIGEGGMGVVYEVRHKLIGRRLAIKAMHPDVVSEPGVVERFRNEARIAGSLGHDHVIEIADLGTMPSGAPYIVMELLEGEDLAHRIEHGGPMKVGDATEILAQVLDALVAVHKAGVVHRDLKPDNVFLAKRTGATGRTRTVVRLLDFGISKLKSADSASLRLTRTGTVLGTPYYMAPEQAAGDKDLDHRVDVYAAGVMLYEALTGRRPFEGDTYNALLAAILTKDAPTPRSLRPDIPEELEDIIVRAMQRRRDQRFPTALAFLQALEPFAPSASAELVRSRPRPSASRVSVVGTPPALRASATAASLAAPPPRRTALWVAAGAVVLAVAIAVFAFSRGGGGDESRPPVVAAAAAPSPDALPDAPPASADVVRTGSFVVTTVLAGPDASAAPDAAPEPDSGASADPVDASAAVKVTPEPDAGTAAPPEAAALPPPPDPADASQADALRPPDRDTGRLTVTIRPPMPGTQVYIDGMPAGTVPLANHPLAPGQHTVLLVNEAARIRKTMSARIRPGQTTVLRFAADELRPGTASAAEAGTTPADAGTRDDAGATVTVPRIDEDYPPGRTP